MDSGNGAAPESDDAHGDRRALERARPSQPSTQPHWVTKISLENSLVVFKTLAKAVAVSTTIPDKAVRFALGVSVGGLLSWLAAAVLEPLYPFTAPRSFFLMLSLSMAMGILFARTRFWDGVFTSSEEKQLERAQQRFTMEMNALDAREAQMRRNGLTGREIEEKLEPERNRVLAALQNVLAAIPVGAEGEKAVMAAIETTKPKELPPKSEP